MLTVELREIMNRKRMGDDFRVCSDVTFYYYANLVVIDNTGTVTKGNLNTRVNIELCWP